jgi:hypothetical protein
VVKGQKLRAIVIDELVPHTRRVTFRSPFKPDDEVSLEIIPWKDPFPRYYTLTEIMPMAPIYEHPKLVIMEILPPEEKRPS